jgi:hypothetical protein
MFRFFCEKKLIENNERGIFSFNKVGLIKLIKNKKWSYNKIQEIIYIYIYIYNILLNNQSKHAINIVILLFFLFLLKINKIVNFLGKEDEIEKN